MSAPAMPPVRTPAKKPSASAPASRPATGDANAAPAVPLAVTRGRMAMGQKVIVYGPGGVGKTELCSLLAQVGIEPLFIDVEDSTKFLDVARVAPATWDETRSVLHDADLLAGFGAVVLDSLTKLEELAVAWTLANVPHEKGQTCKRLEDYGFGKGYTHVYETFLTLLGDLDALARGGKHVICTAHVCTESVPNPQGENWLQYQPRLQSPPKSGKLRERCKEWCDHLLYLDFDKFVADGKAKGSGSRTCYFSELPTHWAKSRTAAGDLPYAQGDPSIWAELFAVK